MSFSSQGTGMQNQEVKNTWNNRQIWPWSTKRSRAKINRVLPRECAGQRKHPLPTTQNDSTHGHHRIVNTKIRLIIFFAAEDGDALYSQQKQDLELTVTQIMSSILQNSDLLRKQGKPLSSLGIILTTSDCTVEVTNNSRDQI